MCDSPLIPLMDKICTAITSGYLLFDLENEKTYITFNEVIAIDQANS